MNSEDPANNTRDVVLLVGLVIIILTGLATEVTRFEAIDSCLKCGSQRSRQTLNGSVWGVGRSKLTLGPEEPSKFVHDFPEFHCSHMWTTGKTVTTSIWDSPAILTIPPREELACVCCELIWERYETDEAYRDSIQELLETGAATRERLVALASESGYPLEEALTPEEEAILKTLYPESESKGAFKPRDQSSSEIFPPRNARPPI